MKMQVMNSIWGIKTVKVSIFEWKYLKTAFILSFSKFTCD